jgi:hypothetical protein
VSGLCVIGAGRRAATGASVDQILKFYYPGLTVGAIPAAGRGHNKPSRHRERLTRRRPVMSRWRCPETKKASGQTVLSLIRRSRDEIAKSTGAASPPRLRVTVHPSVESFGRTTGQPWWVSGATDGAAIDVLPITILRQQGQLDRTIRHEVTHALLDAALAKRPMWVQRRRRGVFRDAGERTSEQGRARGLPERCRVAATVSAGAQRDAYARAEACFARAIADGKRWDQIR